MVSRGESPDADLLSENRVDRALVPVSAPAANGGTPIFVSDERARPVRGEGENAASDGELCALVEPRDGEFVVDGEDATVMPFFETAATAVTGSAIVADAGEPMVEAPVIGPITGELAFELNFRWSGGGP